MYTYYWDITLESQKEHSIVWNIAKARSLISLDDRFLANVPLKTYSSIIWSPVFNPQTFYKFAVWGRNLRVTSLELEWANYLRTAPTRPLRPSHCPSTNRGPVAITIFQYLDKLNQTERYGRAKRGQRSRNSKNIPEIERISDGNKTANSKTK